MTDASHAARESGEEARLVLVVAMGRNGIIGAAGGMPWHLPDDLRHFKALTMGHAMVMGRSTFEAIGRALPGRRTIVVTRNESWRADGVETAADLDDALRRAASGGPDPAKREVMIVGGGQIYQQTINRAHRLEVTEVDASPHGDTWFPAIDSRLWREGSRQNHPGHAFVSYERRAGLGSTPFESTASESTASESTASEGTAVGRATEVPPWTP